LGANYPQATFGEASSLHELHDLVAKERWEVVILDLAFPDGNGLETLKQLKNDHPSLPVLILSMYPEDQYAIRTIRAGASRYLSKESAPEKLVQAHQKILAGGKYISARLCQRSLCILPGMMMISRCINPSLIVNTRYCV